MTIVQFLRILWAQRWVIAIATVFCAIGGIVAIIILPPRWDAKARVMLDTIKPDPVTGVVIGENARAYAATQMTLISDNSVAAKVADQVGWLSDPSLIRAYNGRTKTDVRDFRRWLAAIVIAHTKAQLVEGSNIIEVTYSASDPNAAKRIADALVRSYVDASVAFQRTEAEHNAEWFDTQALTAKAALDTAAAAVADYQHQTGIVLQDDKIDVDSARLRALANQGSGPTVLAPMSSASPAAAELAQVDAALSEASRTLGPNHPQLLALRAKRAALAAQVVQDQSGARIAASAAASSTGAVDRAMASAKARVLGESDQLEKLRQLQQVVELQRSQYEKTAAKAAELHQEAVIGDTGVTILGPAITTEKPSFPNKSLVLAGAVGLGLGAGVMVGLLIELFNRRVRGVEDLQTFDAPVLAAVPRSRGRQPRARSRFGRGQEAPMSRTAALT